MLSALERQPGSIRDHEAMSMYSRNFEGTLEQHERFNRAARAAINQTWWGRSKDRWRTSREQ
jgi:hypothetical protein